MLDLISGDRGPATLPIAQIRRDGGTQPRQGMDEDAVNDYANALRGGEQLPAIDVMFDGATYWLFDGFHRTEAHLRAGLTDIAATIHRGTLEDAQWRSFAANKGHGLRRSNADKERAVRAALKHPSGVGLSNVQVAKHVGVDDKTVARYRADMEATSEIPRLPARTGADGKDRKAPPSRPPGARVSARSSNAAADGDALQSPPQSLMIDETLAVILRVLGELPENPEVKRDVDQLVWLRVHNQPKHFQHALPSGSAFNNYCFIQAHQQAIVLLEAKVRKIFQEAPPPITPPAAPTPQLAPVAPAGSGKTAPSRTERVVELRRLYQSLIDSLPDYGELTGDYSSTLAFRRAVEPMITKLQENLV